MFCRESKFLSAHLIGKHGEVYLDLLLICVYEIVIRKSKFIGYKAPSFEQQGGGEAPGYNKSTSCNTLTCLFGIASRTSFEQIFLSACLRTPG